MTEIHKLRSNFNGLPDGDYDLRVPVDESGNVLVGHDLTDKRVGKAALRLTIEGPEIFIRKPRPEPEGGWDPIQFVVPGRNNDGVSEVFDVPVNSIALHRLPEEPAWGVYPGELQINNLTAFEFGTSQMAGALHQNQKQN